MGSPKKASFTPLRCGLSPPHGVSSTRASFMEAEPQLPLGWLYDPRGKEATLLPCAKLGVEVHLLLCARPASRGGNRCCASSWKGWHEHAGGGSHDWQPSLDTYPLPMFLMTSFLWLGCRIKEGTDRKRGSLHRPGLCQLMSSGFTLFFLNFCF